MTAARRWLLLLVLCLPWVAAAETLRVGPGDDVRDVLARAAPGAEVVLSSGVHRARLVLERPVRLRGEPGAVLDGGGRGDVVRVRAADVTLEGLTIRNGGADLTEMNAAVFVEPDAARVRVLGNRIETPGFGVWLDACRDARVIGNRVRGDGSLRSQDRGNGIHLYATRGAEIRGNDIAHARDGIYIDTSRGNALVGNRIHDLRYGIHYMYSYRNRVADNETWNTRTGYALMQSKHLTVTGNRSHGDRNYGLLMNYITYSEISGNVITGARAGAAHAGGGGAVAGTEGKALFIYNSQFNEIHHNLLRDSDIGVHLTAGSEDNALYANAFVGNHIQVKYVASRRQDWSEEGRGNYWSDYLGWDLNADGVGDRPYEPNDAVDRLVWKYPLARVLMSSPAVRMLRWVQTQFPVLRPPGVRDSAPLMQPPAGMEIHGRAAG